MKKTNLLLIALLGVTALNSHELPPMLTGAQPNVAPGTIQHYTRNLVLDLADDVVTQSEPVLPANAAELEEFLSSSSVSGSSDGSEKPVSKADTASEVSGDGYETAHTNLEEEETYRQRFEHLTSGNVERLQSIVLRRGNTQSLPGTTAEHKQAQRSPDLEEKTPKIVTYQQGANEHSLQEVGIFNKQDGSRALLEAPKTILDILATDKQCAREPQLSVWTVGAMFVATPLIILGGSFFVLDKVGTSAKVSAGTLTTMGAMCAAGEYIIYSNAKSTIYQRVKRSLSKIPPEQLSLLARCVNYSEENNHINPFIGNPTLFNCIKDALKIQKQSYTCFPQNKPKILNALDALDTKFEKIQKLCGEKTFTIHLENTDKTTTLEALLNKEKEKIAKVKTFITPLSDELLEGEETKVIA